ncbi:hypothetical protein VPH35_068725 [Triticum aestivum]
MEAPISAVAGELVSHFISFLINKYQSSLCHAQLEEEKVAETLQHLLMRVATVVEEADARYITNTGMMMQLKMLSEAMYGGHRMLDILRYQAVQKSVCFDEVSSNDPSSNRFYLAKRSRPTTDKVTYIESCGALEILGIAVDNMAKFVVLLSGCEHMSRRPYDVYLYTDNFMFSRHTEKQKILRFLLQHNDPPCYHAPKTLVAHACGDERVRSCFSSVLHLKGDGLLKILDHGSTMEGMRMLIVIEFAFDIGMDRRCKIIIISRLQSLARFGSVKPIFLSALSYDELRYLFKTLAFGSVDPAQHPLLVQVVDEFAKVLHGTPGALVATNTFADVLRRNHNVQYWRCVLDKRKRMVKRNLSMYGGHPSMLIGEGHLVDITDFALYPLSMTRYTINGSTKKELPCLTFGELIEDRSARPKQDFVLVSWESRIPPHNSFAHFVTSHAQDTHEGGALSGRKRRGVSI